MCGRSKKSHSTVARRSWRPKFRIIGNQKWWKISLTMNCLNDQVMKWYCWQHKLDFEKNWFSGQPHSFNFLFSCIKTILFTFYDSIKSHRTISIWFLCSKYLNFTFFLIWFWKREKFGISKIRIIKRTFSNSKRTDNLVIRFWGISNKNANAIICLTVALWFAQKWAKGS